MTRTIFTLILSKASEVEIARETIYVCFSFVFHPVLTSERGRIRLLPRILKVLY